MSRAKRAKLNIAQQEPAKNVGASLQTLTSIEAEPYPPFTALAIKISIVFRTTVKAILNLKG